MFFYQFNILENFIENDFYQNVEIEKKKLLNIIALYSNKKNTLLNITNNLALINNNLEKDQLNDFFDTVTLIKNSFEDVNSLILSANNSKDVLSYVLSLFEQDYEQNLEEIKANLVEYNKKDEELFNKIIEFEEKLTSVLDSAVQLSVSTPLSETSLLTHSLKNISHDNNILVVSEKDQKAYLPYKYLDVLKLYKNHPDIYSSMQDVVNELYILDLNKFKNSSISRFRESFNLMINKEHSSIVKALDLSLELMFKFNLNPIIIAACQNLDELDIYLDCLDKNELDDFDCFEIKFEVTPSKK